MVKIFNPRQTVLITCKGQTTSLGKKEELEDIFPLDWHSPAAHEPLTYAIFVNKKILGHDLIKNSKTFVVNFMPFSKKRNIILAGKHHGEFHNKLELVGLTRQECEKLVDCFKLKEAIGFLECEVINQIDIGDHTLFLGKIVHEIILRQEKRIFHIDGLIYTTTEN